MMHVTPELVDAALRERDRQIAHSQLTRLAACVRACCQAPAGLVARLVGLVRPEPASCGGAR